MTFVSCQVSYSMPNTTFNNVPKCISKLLVTIGIEHRIECAVKVSQPERHGVYVLGYDLRSDGTDIKHDMEGQPAHNVRDDDVAQGHENATF